MPHDPNRRPRRDHRPENRHASSCISELLDAETRKKLEKLKEQLPKEEK